MTRFIIIRHGLSLYNQQRRFQGQLDIPLHDIGIAQAKASAKFVLENYKVDKVYSSDLLRASVTAQPLSEGLGIKTVTDKRLREINMGLWQGMGFDEAVKRFPETERQRIKCIGKMRYDGGESYGEVIERVRAFADEVMKENEGRTVALVSHGGTIRALLSSWMGYKPEDMGKVPIVPNASVTSVLVENGKAEFELMYHTDHLEQVTVTNIE